MSVRCGTFIMLMGTMINYLKSHPDINEVAGLREEALYTVLAEIEVLNVLGCTTGAELVSYMQAYPEQEAYSSSLAMSLSGYCRRDRMRCYGLRRILVL